MPRRHQPLCVSRRAFLQLVGLGAAASACSDGQPKPQRRSVTTGNDDESGMSCQPTSKDPRGPFYESGAPSRTRIADDSEPGERLVIKGRVQGADCQTPLAGVLLDIWQADRDGNYYDAEAQYRLRGTLMTDADGRYEFETIMPGRYVQSSGPRPAHIHFTVSKPGHTALTTQLYFEGDPNLGPDDSCCNSEDRERIIALGSTVPLRGTFDIVLA